MGAKITQSYKYAAFISYAHADEAVAKRLHNALETYPLPKDMRRWNNKDDNRSRLSPIFRDVAELTAHHSLTEKIREAVKTSRFLILLCSPAAKNSHWVNEEIKLFREIHGEAAILAVIVKGKPGTAFPAALTEGGREPLAADMTSKEGFKFGVTQLAASMLGVGLDQLIRRDQKRRRLRTQLVSGSASALALVMGGLAWTAIDARDDARDALDEALISRNASEEMVEFLIKDFKEELVPIQKLDLFETVGQRVKVYYDDIPLENMDDDRLMRRARALHVLGEVELNRGKYETAEEYFGSAHLISEDVYIRNSDNTDATFTHAQSEFWLGEKFLFEENYDKAIRHFTSYNDLAGFLFENDPDNILIIRELAWSYNNLGKVNLRANNPAVASVHFDAAIKTLELATKNSNPISESLNKQLANFLAGSSRSKEALGDKESAIQQRQLQVNIYSDLMQSDPRNNDVLFKLTLANSKLLRLKYANLCDSNDAKFTQSQFELLTEYEPENMTWLVEYLFYWNQRLIDCFKQKKYDDIRTDVSNYLEVAEKHKDNESIGRFAAQVLYIQEQIDMKGN